MADGGNRSVARSGGGGGQSSAVRPTSAVTETNLKSPSATATAVPNGPASNSQRKQSVTSASRPATSSNAAMAVNSSASSATKPSASAAASSGAASSSNVPSLSQPRKSTNASTSESLAVPFGNRAQPPPLVKHPSSSLPSTPSVHARKLSDEYRTPPPPIRVPGTMSPRSARSDSDSTVRTSARTPMVNGVPECKFETGMAFSRRRIPYSVGGDLLEPVANIQTSLDPAGEEKLTGDMRALYDRILPSAESESRRNQLVQKLERILNERWPGNDIKVHVFGSSGNLLCSNDSDVDICITTSMKALERMCTLAAALADHGMERVVCVPNAKVPIVKIWDPELKLACDMNVNNTLALENTRMIRTYVQLDPRVRPLAMVIKYWTRQRILNDAALGGTLSSYTWICLIINFLQTRRPPVLPSLQQRPHLCTLDASGRRSSFADDISTLKGFGAANKETLGELLFHFFKRYGHELDYENSVISIREGGLLSKQNKKWHLMQNNRFCVEEPFNIERNLGNTADDISWRGVHIELRRAFDLIGQSKLDEACEEFVFPPQEEKVWVKPPQQPRPVLTRSLSQQGRTTRSNTSTNNQRANNKNRTGAPSRRASSAAAMNKLPTFNGPVDRLSGSQLHAQLFHHYQLLQAQEQQLRLHMHERAQQAQMNALAGGQLPSIQQPNSAYPLQSGFDSLRPHPVEPGPLSAPLRGMQGPFYPMHASQQLRSPNLPPSLASNQSSTNPPSPTMAAAQMANMPQRPTRSFANDDNSAVRSHSQPPSNSGNMRQGSRPPRTVPTLPNPGLPVTQGLGNTTLQQFQQLYMQAKLSNEAAQKPKLRSPMPEVPNLRQFMDYQPDGANHRFYPVDHGASFGLRTPGFEVPQSMLHPGENLHNRPRRSSGSPKLARQTPRSTSPSNSLGSSDPAHNFRTPQAPLELPRPSSSGASIPVTQSAEGSRPRSGPLIVDGSSDYMECAVTPEPQPFFVPGSDPGHLGGSSYFATTPQPPPAEEPAQPTRGRSRGSAGTLPNILQFGDFPARATLRNHRHAEKERERKAATAVAPLQAAFDEASSSASGDTTGLGIEMNTENAKEPAPTKSELSTPPKPTDPKNEVLDKHASFLSPVREVRTPSPTVTRAGVLSEAVKTKTQNGAAVATGSPARKGSLLAEEVKHEPKRTETEGVSKTRKVDANASAHSSKDEQSSKSKHSDPTPAEGHAKNKKSEPKASIPADSAPKSNGVGPAAKPTAPAATRSTQPAPSAAIPNTAAGGWQQTLSKKAKRNSRKSGSMSAVSLESERKGG